MDTKEKIELARKILNVDNCEAQILKGDKGLIERREMTKIILTEDNKELLND